MSENSQSSIENSQSKEPPEFKQAYFSAFMALILYKIGNVEMITLEHLEEFDAEKDKPIVGWDPEKKAFIIKNREFDIAPKIIKRVPNKIRKKILKSIMRN